MHWEGENFRTTNCSPYKLLLHAANQVRLSESDQINNRWCTNRWYSVFSLIIIIIDAHLEVHLYRFILYGQFPFRPSKVQLTRHTPLTLSQIRSIRAVILTAGIHCMGSSLSAPQRVRHAHSQTCSGVQVHTNSVEPLWLTSSPGTPLTESDQIKQETLH